MLISADIRCFGKKEEDNWSKKNIKTLNAPPHFLPFHIYIWPNNQRTVLIDNLISLITGQYMERNFHTQS